MHKIFSVGDGFPVPDGTFVYPVLEPRMTRIRDGAWIDDVSLAVGKISAQTSSKIHLHPLITQTTWVISGELTIKMKDVATAEPYALALRAEQAVVTQPGTFFQLVNTSAHDCRVVYIVTPAFVFEMDARGTVIYNDAIVLDDSWDALANHHWRVPQLTDLSALKTARAESQERLKRAAG